MPVNLSRDGLISHLIVVSLLKLLYLIFTFALTSTVCCFYVSLQSSDTPRYIGLAWDQEVYDVKKQNIVFFILVRKERSKRIERIKMCAKEENSKNGGELLALTHDPPSRSLLKEIIFCRSWKSSHKNAAFCFTC